jgi:hypothetical protein
MTPSEHYKRTELDKCILAYTSDSSNIAAFNRANELRIELGLPCVILEAATIADDEQPTKKRKKS